MGRPLKKEKDFARSMGEEVEIKLYKAKDGAKDYRGILKAYDRDSVTVEEDGSEIRFLRSEIAAIRLAFDF